jgi:hypothetical protein
MRKKPEPKLEGLVGFYGHVWSPDPDDPRRETLRFQFRIIRRLDALRYVIQYYSMWDGSPNRLSAMSEDELLGDSVKLYPDADLWREIADRFSEMEARRAERVPPRIIAK